MTSSTIRLVTIADCPPYAAVNHRRSSFPGHRCPCLERFAAPRHVDAISGCLPQSPQDAPLQALLSIIPFRCCACEVTVVIVGHIKSFLFTYLLTKHSTIPYVRYSFFLCNSNFVFKTRRFFDIRLQKCRDLEIRVRGHSRTLKMAPFDRLCMVSY